MKEYKSLYDNDQPDHRIDPHRTLVQHTRSSPHLLPRNSNPEIKYIG